MKEALGYIGWYLLTYIILLVIYGISQSLTICVDMQDHVCNFNETKILAFLTVVAYILTPIVAIFGFVSWKNQHNTKIISEEAQKVWKMFNDLSSQTLDLDYEFLKINTPEYIKLSSKKNLLDKINKIFEETEKTINHYIFFNNLANNKEGLDLFMEFYSILRDYKEFIRKNNDNYISKIVDADDEFRNRLDEGNTNIRKNIQKYIFA